MKAAAGAENALTGENVTRHNASVWISSKRVPRGPHARSLDRLNRVGNSGDHFV